MASEIWHARARARRRIGAASLAVAALTGSFVTAAVASATSTSSAGSSIAGTAPSWATSSADRGAVASGTSVDSTVYLQSKDQSGMAAYAKAVATPGNALYHHYLSASQYQARFGTTASQVTAVEAWLRSAGLRIVSANSHEVRVSGTAAQTEAAYGTSLREYSVKGKTYRAPSADAKVPSSVAADVLTIGGLTDMPTEMKPNDLVSTAKSEEQITGEKPTMTKSADGSYYVGQTPCSTYYGQAVDTNAPSLNGTTDNPYVICGYVPSQLRSAYGVFGGVSGRGVTVAIVDAYGSSDILSDADTYAVNHGDPAFRSGQFLDTETPADWTNQTACGGAAGWAPEEHIDVEAVHAMAPGATVHYYGANSCEDADLLASLQQIVDTHSADIVSNSWGEVVYSSTGNLATSVQASYDQVLMQAAIEGIEMNFSSGDCGAEIPTTGCGATDTSTEPQADWPSSSDWATSVGGTSVAIGKHGQVEWNTAWGTSIFLNAGTSWSDYGWYFGGGGGTSAVESQPWYQRGVVSNSLATTLPTGATTTSKMRVTPDVSMDADPYTGFLVGQTQTLPDGSTGYGESAWGGTSLASPLFAGLQADAMQLQGYEPIGFANPAIYARAGSPAYYDVTANGKGTKAYNDMPDSTGTGTEYAVDFGSTQILQATRGYDDVTGVGTPTVFYLWSHLRW
ncbi:S8/S53 family peptidase [Actinospica sp. MGRD01-02]|uniref:S8/S53 family peptidase n=1 Tax=Actinospica acidithermotolerans TaxID=2828514 RepID=A0A941IKY4_9ACTN|nr:S53 family peptidase [Actinospica acidithermotolerans]MBR7831119.1 S8/S53 family peptidase [Actinospica acidithermotolerans]